MMYPNVPSKPQPKRILFVHSSDELYGSDQVLLNLVTGLDRRQFEPIVALPTDLAYKGELSEMLKARDIRCYKIKMGVLRRRYFKPYGFMQYLFYTVWGVWQLSKIIRQHQIELIHSNTSAVLGGMFAAKIHRLPHLWHIHEIIEEPAWLGSLLYTIVLAGSDEIVAVSQAVAECLRHHAKNRSKDKHIHVIWNGVDCEHFNPYIDDESFRQALGIQPTEILIGIIGRISHLKGQELFLDGSAQALKTCQNLQMLILGNPIPGEEDRLIHLYARSKSLGIEQKVHFLPFSNDIPQVMRGLDFLVSSSILPESLGLVILEAMACGRPVIAAAHGGPLEIIVDGETGLLFCPNDSKALADQIILLASNLELRDKLGKAARKFIENDFSLTNFYRKFTSLYLEMFARLSS